MRMPYAKAYGIRFSSASRLGWQVMTTDEPLPRALEILWRTRRRPAAPAD